MAAIYLFSGGGLLLIFIRWQIAFFQYWQNPESLVISTADSFLRQYSEFFELAGINPLQTLIAVIYSLAIGYGILRRKIWAHYLAFAVAVFNLIFYSRNILHETLALSRALEIIFCLYTLWVLTMKKPRIDDSEDKAPIS